MIVPLLLTLASVPAAPASEPVAVQTTRQTLFDVVEAHMSAQGRPIFHAYVAQTLLPKVTADQNAGAQYLQSLHALVAAPTLDVDAVSRLIEQRKQAENGATAAIRSSAFAMIRSLPVADRKLALTTIFADARLPGKAAPAAPPAPKK